MHALTGLHPCRQVLREWLPSGTAAIRLNIDATRRGNLARFFNHSCDGGNLQLLLARWARPCSPRLAQLPLPAAGSGQPTLVAHRRACLACRRTGCLLPRVVFVTSRAVQQGEELTWCYGRPPNGGPGGRPCHCGTSACLGFMPHEEV